MFIENLLSKLKKRKGESKGAKKIQNIEKLRMWVYLAQEIFGGKLLSEKESALGPKFGSFQKNREKLNKMKKNI